MSERAWRWRDAGPADYGVQAALFNECFGKDKDPETFRWKYASNPHGRAVSLVALGPGDEVVGGYSYVPRWFRVDGKRVLLMQASDAMVSPAARRQRIFTGLDDLVAERCGADGVPVSFAYSGRLSYNGFLGNGWADIGRAALLRYRFTSRRGLDRLGRVSPLARAAAPLLDAAWRSRDARRAPRWAEARAALVPLERFDERADELFEAAVPARGVFGERDAAWLNWRYLDTPGQRERVFGLPSADGRGWDAWLVAEFVGEHGYLVDHLARDAAARQRLLTGFTALCHEQRVQEATAMLCDHHPAVPLLNDLGYAAPRRDKLFRDRFPFIVRRCRDDADKVYSSLTSWHLADGDRDAEHMSP